MTQHGETHRLLVEHEHDGLEDVPLTDGGTREAHVSRVYYYIEHPRDCLTEAERLRAEEQRLREAGPSGPNGPSDPPDARDACPIDQEIENVGLLEALGVDRHGAINGQPYGHIIDHLQEGAYHLNAWYRHYSGPEGEDWDGGLEHERIPDEPKPPAPPRGFTLATP